MLILIVVLVLGVFVKPFEFRPQIVLADAGDLVGQPLKVIQTRYFFPKAQSPLTFPEGLLVLDGHGEVVLAHARPLVLLVVVDYLLDIGVLFDCEVYFGSQFGQRRCRKGALHVVFAGAWHELYGLYALVHEAGLRDLWWFEAVVLLPVGLLQLPEDHLPAGVQVLRVVDPVLLDPKGQLSLDLGEELGYFHEVIKL